VGLESVNGLLQELGLKQTRLRRKMLDVDAARAGRENTATPRELLELLGKLQRGELLDAAHTKDCISVLGTPKHSYLRLPEEVRIATKTGSLEGVRAEAGLVFATRRPFAIVVMTAMAGDEKAAEDVIGAIGTASLQAFERLGRSTPQGRVLYPRAEQSP
jgi:beta-lactamase class A